MEVKVYIPDGKFCERRGVDCPFLQDVVDNWEYTESHDWCAYLRKDLTSTTEYFHKIKKIPECPAYPSTKQAKKDGLPAFGD